MDCGDARCLHDTHVLATLCITLAARHVSTASARQSESCLGSERARGGGGRTAAGDGQPAAISFTNTFLLLHYSAFLLQCGPENVTGTHELMSVMIIHCQWRQRKYTVSLRRKHEDVASVSASRGVFKVKDLYVDLDYNVINNPLLSLSCSSTAALLAFAAQTWRPPSDPLALRGGHACNSAGLCFVICAFFALSPRDGRTKSSFRKNCAACIFRIRRCSNSTLMLPCFISTDAEGI